MLVIPEMQNVGFGINQAIFFQDKKVIICQKQDESSPKAGFIY